MRLVTRADFDGLVCGALITKFEKIDDYLYVEPKFMQDGLVEIRRGDIIANLPYHPNCTLWFDHHITNTTPDFRNADRSRPRRLSPRPQRRAGRLRVLSRTCSHGRYSWKVAARCARARRDRTIS